MFFSQPVYSQTQLEDEIEALRVSQQQRDSLLRVLFQQRHAIQDSVAAYSKALEYLERTLAIEEKVLGPEHPDVATSYNNIGFVSASQGDYVKAVEYFKRALSILEKVLGPEHPDVVTNYINIGSAYDEYGDYVKALYDGCSCKECRRG